MKTLLGLFILCAGWASAASWFLDDTPQNISIRITLKSQSTVYGQRTPQPIIQPIPQYPLALRRELVTGEATVRFTVTAEGKTVGLELLNSSQKGFGDAAMAAAKDWVFVPGTDVDRKTAIPVHMEFHFEFAYHDEIPIP